MKTITAGLLILKFLQISSYLSRPNIANVIRYSISVLKSVANDANILSDRTIPTALKSDFAQSFVAQKNFILLEKFIAEIDGNLTDIASNYVNFCDESFDLLINDKIKSVKTELEKKQFGKIRYEINSARQKKLMEADGMLRGILATGGLKQMEAKLAFHLRRAEIDMAFMVILQLNIEDALNAGAEKAVQILTHLKTLITEHQDKIVSPPVRLMRMLLRIDDTNIRKQMLRQKLLIGDNAKSATLEEEPLVSEASNTTVPQCEHIVVQAVSSWGGADVTFEDLQYTIADVLSQVGVGHDLCTLLT